MITLMMLSCKAMLGKLHLYKKYYEKGIDPEKRIGSNGPVPKEKGVQ